MLVHVAVFVDFVMCWYFFEKASLSIFLLFMASLENFCQSLKALPDFWMELHTLFFPKHFSKNLSFENTEMAK